MWLDRRREAALLRGAVRTVVPALAASLLFVGCSRDRPNVIVVVADTLRADRLGVAGSPSGLTPFLDSLARSGMVFTNAYSTTSWTNAAVASLFTSRFPSQHQVVAFNSRLPDAEVTLGERLHDAGWRGLGSVGNFRLTRGLGFAQGFDVWFSRMLSGKMTTQQLAQDAVRYYDRHIARFFWRRWSPLLLYVHPMEPHAPYDPPAQVRAARIGEPPPGTSEADVMAKVIGITRWKEVTPAEAAYVESLYDGEVVALDDRLRRLFSRLRTRGLLERAIVVVTADHGEEFGEHAGFQHGRALYEESVRVPLIISGPGLPAGRIVHDRVSLVDVAPTVLELAGLPPEPRFEGRSLVPRSGDEARELGSQGILLELLPTGAPVDLRRHTAGIVLDERKLLETWLPQQGSETFDLRRDAGETRPNPPELTVDATALDARLAQRRADLRSRAGTAESAAIEATMRARLRALGYAN